MARDGATSTMSMREVGQLKTIQVVVDGGLRICVAAQRLGLSRRQVERLLLRYRAQDAAGLLSLKRGRPSNHQLPDGLAECNYFKSLIDPAHESLSSIEYQD